MASSLGARIDAFPTGFRPPHCYALSQHLEEAGHAEHWLWLEDLSAGRGGQQWTMGDRYQAAYALGLISGALADPRTLAPATWLVKGATERYLQ